MINPRPEYQEIGEQISKLLASEHCPRNLRGMLEAYLSDLYQQTNLLKPEIVNSLFPYLMLANESFGNSAGEQQAESPKGEPVSLESQVEPNDEADDDSEISSKEISDQAWVSEDDVNAAGRMFASKQGVTGKLGPVGVI